MKRLSAIWVTGLIFLLLICILGTISQTQETLQQAKRKRGQAVELFVSQTGDSSLQGFIEEHLSPEFRAALSPEDLLEQMKQIRFTCSNAGGIMWEPLDENGIRITFERAGGIRTILHLRVQPSPPYLINELSLQKVNEKTQDQVEEEPMTWDRLEQRLKDKEKEGFSGVVLVVRDDKLILFKGYGMANREQGIHNTKDTIFAIGSTPIDFTKAAVLKLMDLGKLKMSDPITKYFLDVPEDKQSITIEHLMTGQSGLSNFHHIPGQDADYDLTWIDRETAIKRILGKDLLFSPGQGEQHSHSAWGLLAAIVEIVSGKSYKEFLDVSFFIPAGMSGTGLYQDTVNFKESDIAVGYSPGKVGKINAPQYWGPTSWLVMGSGGMVSNPGDLYKWIQALRYKKLLSPESLEKYWSHGVLAGGNDRGFLCIYTEGPGSMMILCSNSHTSMSDSASQLGRALARLVTTGRK
jgi:CubicO group peptidase (beta-lactamase class C family)